MLYLVTKPNGEVIVNTVFNDLSVNSELVGEILPDAMVATADIQNKLHLEKCSTKLFRMC